MTDSFPSAEGDRARAGIAADPAAGRPMPAVGLETAPLGTARMFYPLSSVQREIWIDEALCPGTPVYNIGGYVRIRGWIDAEVFRQAMTRLVRETDVLRLVLTERDGVPWQSFPEMPHVELGVCDYSSEKDPLRAALSAIEQSMRRPFRIFEEPLFRSTLYKLSADRYLLSQVIHHLVADGWAISLITQRVAALYNALLRRDPLPDRPGAAYADFIENDATYVGSAAFERHRRYWGEKFATLPEPLLSRRSGFAGRTGVVPGAVHTRFLPRAQYVRLESMAQSCSVSVFHVLLGLLYVYFTRTQDRDECVIGLPVLNRSGPAFKRTIGLFASMIPARFGFGRSIDFIGLVQAIAAGLRESYRAQRFPISEINRLAGVLRTGRERLFDLSLSFERHDYAVRFDAADPCETVALTHGFEQTPLAVFVREYSASQDVQIDFAYNLAYFDAEEITRIRQRFQHLIEEVLAHPGRSIAALDILPPAERHRLLIEWNATATPLPEACVHQMFEAQAERTPEATAVVFEDESLSYGELNARANRLAHALIARGIGPDGLVAIALERSPAMIVALLAVLKAGGAYVPLDPDYPAERLAFMLDDCGARILITEEGLLPRLPQTAAHILCLDAEAANIATLPDDNPGRPVGPRHLAYVIYTSGSTGRPKGVAIEHRALLNLLVAMQRSPGFGRPDALLAVTTVSFDIFGLEIHLPLISGGRIVLAKTDEAADPAALSALLEDQKITVLQATPATWRMLIAAGWPGKADLRMLAGGEALPGSLAKAMLSRGGSLWNLYGPTETTIWSGICPVVAEETDHAVVSIGRPIANTQAYVLDTQGQPTPIGVAGELHIGGSGLARGYLNRPELTAEKFIPDPFSETPGARLYKTGDRVRWRADGNLEFLGRLDHQVKIRGFRIELGEIEAALAAHPMIREAVVVARVREDGDQHLVAYLVAEGAITTSELRAVLKATLPDYMIPAAFVFLDALPLTPNGKLDRKALPEPEAAAPATGTAPRDALEEIVAGLWAEVLHRDAVEIEANFFELGGHSLLATQLASRLRDALGVTVPVRWIFEAPTVAELTERLRPSLVSEGVGDAERTIPPAPRDRPLPLSFAQRRLWFLDQMEGPSPTYNMPGVIDLAGDLDVEVLGLALSAIVRRHEALRTCLRSEDGEPIQVILPAQPVALPVVELRTATEPEAEAARLTREEAVAPFELANDVPLRARLLRRGEAAWTLLITLHHSAADGWSVGVLIRELATLYAAFHEGRPSPLPELPIQYADFALWQRGWLSGERLKRQTAYWRDQLAGAPECLVLPTDRPRPARQSHRGASLAFTIDGELAAGLRSLSRRSGTTLFMTLLAAWASLLGRYGGDDDLVIGSPVANRTHSAIEPLIGFFVNTLALRADLSGNPSFRDLLARLRHACLEAYAHQELPFEHLVERLEVPRNLAHAPLFQVMFVLQNNAQAPLVLPGLDVGFGESDSTIAKFDLTLSIAENADGLAASLEYATDLFDPSTIERMGGHFVRLLRSALADPDRPIRALDILPPAERHQLLIEWNATAAPLPDASSITALFAEAVAAHRGAVVVSEAATGRTLTFAELDARSDRLAANLGSLVSGSEPMVGIAGERSAALITGVFGVLKAGAVYLPLEPAYPDERLRFMIEDSGVTVLLADATARARLVPLLGGLDRPVRMLALEADLPPPPAGWRAARPQPQQAAYLVYTSGSTGQPKAVIGLHGASVNRFVWMARERPFGPGEVGAVKTALGFVDSVWEVAGFPALGCPVAVAPAGAVRDPVELARFCAASGVTRLTVVPSLLSALLDDPGAKAAMQGVRLWVSSGEALPADLAARFAAAFPQAELLNLYGSSEVAGDATWAVVDAAGTPPIGRPIANTQAYVLDADGQPVPIGVAGELHIGGAGLARG